MYRGREGLKGHNKPINSEGGGGGVQSNMSQGKVHESDEECYLHV